MYVDCSFVRVHWNSELLFRSPFAGHTNIDLLILRVLWGSFPTCSSMGQPEQERHPRFLPLLASCTDLSTTRSECLSSTPVVNAALMSSVRIAAAPIVVFDQ